MPISKFGLSEQRNDDSYQDLPVHLDDVNREDELKGAKSQ